ncbi:GNAT family N-acetyltransferase [Paenibacillus guangzhouensis]|uniref:GNAT family N-acetyltransferase n=1 Tax=Paenibacillus guangzhouensis TaxID=1473112 RepID=UPI001266DE2F|nr:GNAT family N-acetyltransferase [Paenibacillus guangzhouensis]
MNIQCRRIHKGDPAIISRAFAEQGWNKPQSLYERYVEEHRKGERVTIITEVDGAFAGYVNVLWHSGYPSFHEQGIPEINDFNVLIQYRRQGIGSILMDEAEAVIRERSAVAGIGVGLFSDYGNAQILYAKRGYVPDGKGIYSADRYVGYGDMVRIDDDIALYLTKALR